MKEAGFLFLKAFFPEDNLKDLPKLLNPKKFKLRGKHGSYKIEII